MKVIENKYLPPSRRFAAINLFGVIFARRGVPLTKRMLNHEAIHTAQMRELGFVPFYLAYVIEWFVRLPMKGNAYYNISFEREAYLNDHDFNYLNSRRHLSSFRYLTKKQTRKLLKLRHNY